MTTTCVKCGSDKIIPDVRILDRSRSAVSQDLQVVIEGKPQAMFFKEGLYGRLTANICGECGHTELKVHNPKSLYRKYLKTLGTPE